MSVKAITAENLAQAVRDRLSHGRELWLDGENGIRIQLRPASSFATTVRDGGVREIDLPPEAVAALAEAFATGRGVIPGAPLIVEVVA